MSEPTIVTLAILVFVLIMMLATLLKSGHEAAIKMWGVMGALTGVAFGAITSYYFAEKSYQSQITQLETDKASIQLALTSIKESAIEAKSSVAPFIASFKGVNVTTNGFPVAASYAKSLPKDERIKILNKLIFTSKKLSEIEAISISGWRKVEKK